MRTFAKIALIVTALFAAAGYLVYLRRCHHYPYGVSHCCDVALWFALLEYAGTHGGRFPAGEATPEASLSLLYREGLADEEILRGKTVPESVVRDILARGELLGPDTCGWHYVEGLTLADDPRLALFWDKAGLNHNGGRMSDGNRYVALISGAHEFIPGGKWPEFLKEQETLLKARTKAAVGAVPLLSASVKLPSGEIVTQYDAPYTLEYMEEHESGRSVSPALVSGGTLTPAALRWWTLGAFGMGGARSGRMTLTLTLGAWRSNPVEISVSDGIPKTSSFVFEMMSSRKEDPQTPHPADRPQ